MSVLLLMTWKATLALGVALLAAVCARRAAASTRHAMLVAGQLAALTMPLLAPVVPPIHSTALTALPIEIPSTVATHAAPAPARTIDPLLAIWLTGCAIIAATRIRSLARAWRIARGAQPFGDVFLSADVEQPVTIGRRIILPLAAATWDAAHRDAVLLHERAHVARHDSVLGLAGDAVCAVYWFHPLAWLVARRARLERERACDDAVLAHGVRGVDYAATLLDVARGMHVAGGMAMAHRSQLELRIRAILGSPVRVRAARATRSIVAIIAIATAPVVAALTPMTILRPASGEPDLLGDAVASPFSEHLPAPHIDVPASGPDAALIAKMQLLAQQPPRNDIDFVPDRARWALAQVRNGQLVTKLIAALADSDWRVRTYAAWSLGVAGDARATNAILPLLDEPIWRVRAMAAFALQRINDPTARDAMQRALADPAWQVRVCAVRYLAAQNETRALLHVMKSDRHVVVRDAAEEGLR